MSGFPFFAGADLTADDLNAIKTYVDGRTFYLPKGNTKVVSASTVFVDDDILTAIAFAAGTVWEVSAYLEVTGSSKAGQFQWRWAVGGGLTTSSRFIVAPSATTTTLEPSDITAAAQARTTSSAVSASTTAGTNHTGIRDTFIITNTTLGVLGLQWSQNVASGTTTLGAASYIIARQIS